MERGTPRTSYLTAARHQISGRLLLSLSSLHDLSRPEQGNPLVNDRSEANLNISIYVLATRSVRNRDELGYEYGKNRAHLVRAPVDTPQDSDKCSPARKALGCSPRPPCPPAFSRASPPRRTSGAHAAAQRAPAPPSPCPSYLPDRRHPPSNMHRNVWAGMFKSLIAGRMYSDVRV